MGESPVRVPQARVHRLVQEQSHRAGFPWVPSRAISNARRTVPHGTAQQSTRSRLEKISVLRPLEHSLDCIACKVGVRFLIHVHTKLLCCITAARVDDRREQHERILGFALQYSFTGWWGWCGQCGTTQLYTARYSYHIYRMFVNTSRPCSCKLMRTPGLDVL